MSTKNTAGMRALAAGFVTAASMLAAPVALAAYPEQPIRLIVGFSAGGTTDVVARVVGKEVGVSDWITVTQETIDKFAEATSDYQYIHVDPVRAAAETPFGGTIAHGFLSLSLLSAMNYNCLPKIREQTMGINYGFEKVRFMTPVKSGMRALAACMPACASPYSAKSVHNVVPRNSMSPRTTLSRSRTWISACCAAAVRKACSTSACVPR